ncbi:MAG: hypothetical protein AB1938_22610 [Myxococcota bacterium]
MRLSGMKRTSAWAAALVAAAILGCPAPPPDVDGGDASTPDAGTDAGPVDAGPARPDAGPPDASLEYWDGGLLIYGAGCVSPDRNKVIFIVDSRYPQWCAYISMRRWDGGFPPLFPDFHAPEDFKVDDARFDLCKDLELATTLDPSAFPLDELHGELVWGFVYDERPRSYHFDGGLRMGPWVFRAQVFAGLVRDCKGN